MNKILQFIKQEAVLCVALILAVCSSFIVTPDEKYIDYIDFKTLGILFCLMAVMVGMQEIGVFEKAAKGLLERAKSLRMVMMVLVLLCFFSGMFITNDVALITFVPLAMITLKLLGKEFFSHYVIPVVVLQTLAANMGSMLTPIGNPQNLYLYGISGLSMGAFLKVMLPYTGLALLMLLGCIMIVSRKENKELQVKFEDVQESIPKKEMLLYVALFLLSLASVARFVPWMIAVVIVLLAVIHVKASILKKVDYSLLFTFVGFFVFIGNMGRVDVFHNFLKDFIGGREILTAIVSSQVMSNVPAALLLSEFTANYKALIIGTNIGGLGTLIASMASLISFKFISRKAGEMKGKYFVYFTLANIGFLIPMLILIKIVL